MFLGDPAPEERLVAVFSMGGDFTFYADESYGAADAYAVAGYVASVEQWKLFIKAWDVLKQEEGFSVLHKRLLEHSAEGSEFEWPNLSDRQKAEKKKAINSKACQIILKHVLGGACQTVRKSEWQKVMNSGQVKWPEYLGKSYYAAGVFGCLNLTSALFKKKRKVGMIRYVFEAGAEGSGEAQEMLRRLYKDEHARELYRIGGYSFESKSNPAFIPLQAADFLAYEAYRQIDNQVLGRGVKLDSQGRLIGPRGALKCLLRADDPKYADVHPYALPAPFYGVWLDRAEIKDLASMVNRLEPE